MEELDSLTVERARRGDRRAQEVFLHRYVRPLHALVRRLGPPGESDDLTQELLGKLLVAIRRYEPGGRASLTTWVFTVAHRWIIDEHRRRHLQLVPLADGLEVPDPSPSPQAAVERAQLATLLETAICALPEAQRRVFVLAQVHGHPLERVAEEEGVALGTVKSRLHRAKAVLALALREAEKDEKERARDAFPRRA